MFQQPMLAQGALIRLPAASAAFKMRLDLPSFVLIQQVEYQLV